MSAYQVQIGANGLGGLMSSHNVTALKPGMIMAETDHHHQVKYVATVLFVYGEYQGFRNHQWRNGERVLLPGYHAWPQRICIVGRRQWGALIHDGWNSSANVWACS